MNVGCVPSKTMIRAAEALHGAQTAHRFPGLNSEAQVADWSALIAAKDDLVATLRQKKYADLLPGYGGVTYLDEGPARLVLGGVEVGPHPPQPAPPAGSVERRLIVDVDGGEHGTAVGATAEECPLIGRGHLAGRHPGQRVAGGQRSRIASEREHDRVLVGEDVVDGDLYVRSGGEEAAGVSL